MKRIDILASIVILLALFNVGVFNENFTIIKGEVLQAQSDSWPMAGANPQRTSWTPQDISGDPATVAAIWAKKISPLVSSKVQPIAADGKIFISSAKGVYAFNADSGNQLWVYATQMPIGHSASYADGVVYAAGFDRKIHAINASTGQGNWTFLASGPFDTNPLVANGKIYTGSRDGKMYAVNSNGSSAWNYQTGAPINQSAAYKAEPDGVTSTSNGVIFFGSNDGYAYGLNADNGQLVWRSDSDPDTPGNQKMPGMGFRSWWPVVYRDWVVFTRTAFESGQATGESTWLFNGTTLADQIPGIEGNEPGDWVEGEKTVNVSTNPNGGTYPDYFETYPSRRQAIFLNRITGVEEEFDIDGDGIKDAPPVSFAADAGTRYPPLVSGNSTPTDSDDVIYFRSITHSTASDAFGGSPIMGWKVGTPFISLPTSKMTGITGYWAGDEANGISSAGNKLYWNWSNDRFIGAADLTQPNTTFPENNNNRQWRYIYGTGYSARCWEFNDPTQQWQWKCDGLPPDYHVEVIKYFWRPFLDPPSPASFWAEHDTAGPIIYNGRLYAILSNALVAFAPGGAGTNAPVLPTAPEPSSGSSPDPISQNDLTQRLEDEVNKIVQVGHLKPTFTFFGAINHRTDTNFDNYTSHYWHNPTDLFYVLLRAREHINLPLKQSLDNYLQSEFANYSPAQYAHIGFTEGVQRDAYIYPPYQSQRFDDIYTSSGSLLPKQTGSGGFSGWGWPPHNAYSLWKYAAAGLGDPNSLFSSIQNKLKAPITTHKANLINDYLSAYPHVHNAYIAGYKGYIELADLAGVTTGANGVPIHGALSYEEELNRLLTLRTQNFATFPEHMVDPTDDAYFYVLVTAWNFMYMIPELADYLQANIPTQVQSAIDTYQAIAPYWMIAHNGETQGESAIMPYQQTYAMFQAKALVLNESYDELTKNLDSPIYPVGDLYYIDNLVSTIEAGEGGPPEPTPTPGIPGDINGDGDVNIQDYIILSNAFGTTDPDADLNDDGTVNIQDYIILSNNF